MSQPQYDPRLRLIDVELLKRLKDQVVRLNAAIAALRTANLATEMQVEVDEEGAVVRLTDPRIYRIFSIPETGEE